MANPPEQAGPFQKQLRARVEKQAGLDLVFVTCQFKRAVVDARLSSNARRQVSGLWFAPGQATAPSSAPPPYAKAGAYREKDFTVVTGEWHLPGTLTLPVGITNSLPAIVLVHGSGPNDRDETILANKPFRDLAWGLATKGIAVLRYEKRTKEYAAKFLIAGLHDFTVQHETIDDALSAQPNCAPPKASFGLLELRKLLRRRRRRRRHVFKDHQEITLQDGHRPQGEDLQVDHLQGAVVAQPQPLFAHRRIVLQG